MIFFKIFALSLAKSDYIIHSVQKRVVMFLYVIIRQWRESIQ